MAPHDPEMSAVAALLGQSRLIAMLLGAASALMLGAAFWFQHVEGLEPCPLCVAQRWAHGAALALAFFAAFLATRRTAAGLLLLVGLAFLAGAGIAAYHVGVEQHWFASAFCGGGETLATTVEELKAQLLATEVARCDEIPWSLLGLSMAGWNLLVSAALAAIAFAAARAAARKLKPKGTP